MLLRNEESEFVQEEVGSLNEGDFKSHSHSDDEANSAKNSNNYTPNRQPNINQETRYG